MKKIISTIILVLIIVAFILFGRNIFPGLPFGIKLFNEVTVREMIFEYMKPINELTTVEYCSKVVFPYDFYTYEEYSGNIFERFFRRKREKKTPYEERKLEIGREYNTEIMKICSKSGLKINKRDYKFIILVPIVSIGINFEDSLYNKPLEEITEDDWKKLIVEEKGDGKKITITLPPVEIIDMQLMDKYKLGGSSGFNVNSFGEIKKHLYLKMRIEVEESGAIEKAKENIENFFVGLLTKTKDVEEVEVRFLKREDDYYWNKDKKEDQMYLEFYKKFKELEKMKE